ncbi:MAG: thrombospondin type 3 repeat-containing protein [Pseudomonadota bacterium]
MKHLLKLSLLLILFASFALFYSCGNNEGKRALLDTLEYPEECYVSIDLALEDLENTEAGTFDESSEDLNANNVYDHCEAEVQDPAPDKDEEVELPENQIPEEDDDSEEACPESVRIGTDIDLDGLDDACDTNNDNDSFEDTSDNCALIDNEDQADIDADGIGDACDTNNDNDSIEDISDNCVLIDNEDQVDTDADGMGDACDDNDDDDLFVDAEDNCALVSNDDQLDTDLDGIGDVCDESPMPYVTLIYIGNGAVELLKVTHDNGNIEMVCLGQMDCKEPNEFGYHTYFRDAIVDIIADYSSEGLSFDLKVENGIHGAAGVDEGSLYIENPDGSSYDDQTYGQELFDILVFPIEAHISGTATLTEAKIDLNIERLYNSIMAQ